VFRDRHAPQTIVAIPSLSLDRDELRKLEGAEHYEERLLCALMLLRFPRANIVYVTREPLALEIVDYYLNLLPGVPPSHARPRLALLSCHDRSADSLTGKILSRAALVGHIRAAIPDPMSAHMTCFNVTPQERTLAVRLGIPIYACDPELAHLGSKSGSRATFRRAGVPLPERYGHLRDAHDITQSLADLKRRDPRLHRAMIKLNDALSGKGNAIFSLEFLTDGRYDTATSVYSSLNGNPCSFHATDNLQQASYVRLTPDKLTDIAVNHDLHFDAAPQWA